MHLPVASLLLGSLDAYLINAPERGGDLPRPGGCANKWVNDILNLLVASRSEGSRRRRGMLTGKPGAPTSSEGLSPGTGGALCDPADLLGDFGSLLNLAEEWRSSGEAVPDTAFLVSLFIEGFLTVPLQEKKVSVSALVRQSLFGDSDCVKGLLDGLCAFLDADRQSSLISLLRFFDRVGWGLVYPWTGDELWQKTEGGDKWSEMVVHMQAEKPARQLLESMISGLDEALEEDEARGAALIKKCGAENMGRWVEAGIPGADVLMRRFGGVVVREEDRAPCFF